MNLFEAIFVRKSVRSYTNEGISPKVLEDILKQFDEINDRLADCSLQATFYYLS